MAGEVGQPPTPALTPAAAPATPASVELAVQAAVNRALAALLVPGTVVDARLGAVRPDGTVPLTVGGRTVLATATVPLPADSDVQLEVLAGDGPRRLRVVGGGDRAQASSPDERLARLGVPRTPLTAIALGAFETAGAPLSGERLRAAAGDLAGLPAGQHAGRAGAHAALAAAGAPVTPALIALATRAVSGGLPDAAGALRVAQVALTALSAAPAGLTAVPASLTGTPPPPATVIADRPGAERGPPVRVETRTGGPRSAPIAPAVLARTLADAIAPLAALAIPDAGRDGAAAVRSALALAGIRPGPAPAEAAVAAPRTADPGPAGPRTPDSAPRVADSGLRTPDSAPRVADSDRPLLDRVADAGRALRSAEGAAPSTVEARVALDAAARELAAPSVLRPAHLADYALVVPLVLSDRGQPTPARLAISRRPGGSGGDATFLRVDAQLSRLGQVSVRLSALDHGPLSIAIAAGSRAQDALAEVLPELEATLRERGLVATLRLIADDDAASGHAG